MNFYNKIMLYFWLCAAILIFIVITYLSITEGFKKWAFYYVFAFLAFLAFITRKWMMKRMEKHLQFLEEQKKADNK